MGEQLGIGGTRSSLRLGFFTAVTLSEGGYVGGYLVLNGVGRPLEFHCTTVVRPSRAHEILYGPTLKPYLFGEQMAPALLAKAKTAAQIIFVSEWEALSLAQCAEQPVALVITSHRENSSQQAGLLQLPTANNTARQLAGMSQPATALLECEVLPACQRLRIGKNELVIPAVEPDASAKVQELISPLAATFDLSEPFGRIKAALEEALRRG